MAYGIKWKPSKTAKKKFAQQMDEIAEFCATHNIQQSNSGDSYYFVLNGVKYRISNHTIEASNRGAYNWLGEQVRKKYHANEEQPDIVYITAGKTRICEIYNNLAAGKKLDRRGNVID